MWKHTKNKFRLHSKPKIQGDKQLFVPTKICIFWVVHFLSSDDDDQVKLNVTFETTFIFFVCCFTKTNFFCFILYLHQNFKNMKARIFCFYFCMAERHNNFNFSWINRKLSNLYSWNKKKLEYNSIIQNDWKSKNHFGLLK